MDKGYWEKYYATHRAPDQPSLFAQFILSDYLSREGCRLLELGCGNGRDSLFFARNGMSVLAVDQAESEIAFLEKENSCDNLKFQSKDFTALDIDELFSCIYSRFTLHSIREEEEQNVLRWCYDHVSPEGLFFIEARSVNDPKLAAGERISENENIFDGHYRRYFNLEAFKQRLKATGFSILYAEEKTGFAPFGDEDPPVVRVVAQR